MTLGQIYQEERYCAPLVKRHQIPTYVHVDPDKISAQNLKLGHVTQVHYLADMTKALAKSRDMIWLQFRQL